jgi:hypothetical protein
MPSTIIHILYTTIFIRETRHTNVRVNFYLQPSRGLRIVSFIKVREFPYVPFYLTCLISRSAAFLRLGSCSYPACSRVSRFVTPYIGFIFDLVS